MTDVERGAWVRQVRRTLRDERVRRGTLAPKTMREMKIYLDARAEKDERAAARIARAQRLRKQPEGDQEGDSGG